MQWRIYKTINEDINTLHAAINIITINEGPSQGQVFLAMWLVHTNLMEHNQSLNPKAKSLKLLCELSYGIWQYNPSLFFINSLQDHTGTKYFRKRLKNRTYVVLLNKEQRKEGSISPSNQSRQEAQTNTNATFTVRLQK